eukprot:Skav204439  [mRNA]  locus=scaffold1093:240907:243318:+ [translate_table: standard]
MWRALSLPLLASAACHGCSNHAPTLLQLKTKEVLHSREIDGDDGDDGDWKLLQNLEGNCLEASASAYNGARCRMARCDTESLAQRWVYNDATGLIKHASGKCLDVACKHRDRAERAMLDTILGK